MSTRWRPHVTVAAVVEQDNRFLMVEELVDGRPVYNQPAGHLEDGESLTEAVIRETLEETAGRFMPEAVVGVYRWIEPTRGRTYLRTCFTGRCAHFDPRAELDAGIQRAVWLELDELRRGGLALRSPLVLRCIEDYRRGRRYPMELFTDV